MKSLLSLLLISSPVLAQIKPLLNEGEVKITYPCSMIDQLPKEKEEAEKITFYDKDKNPYSVSGLIIRKREHLTEKNFDFTVKYRTNHQSILLDEELHAKLSKSDAGEFECEFDISYHPISPGVVFSCAFKSPTDKAISLHKDFLKMVNVSVPDFSLNMSDMKAYQVNSTSWKYKLTPKQKKENPFKKAPSLEKWVTRGECRLEISGKLEAKSSDPAVLHPAAQRGFTFLKSLMPGEPSAIQGNKTEWVIRGR